MNICVYGAASQQIQTAYLQAAERLGYALGRAGFGLVFGGGSTGVMGAVARGMARTGGELYGVAPEFFHRDGILYPHCTELILTETMRQRKEKMEQLSQAFIMAPGGIGTMEEFFEILTLKQLGRHEKPIAVLNTEGYFSPLSALLEGAVREGFLEKSALGLYRMYREPEALVGDLARALGQEMASCK